MMMGEIMMYMDDVMVMMSYLGDVCLFVL